MRDVIKILAAGSVLTAYALIAPTVVEAVPGAGPGDKPFAQRLALTADEAPVSAVETFASRADPAPRSSLPSFVRLEAVR